MGFQDDRGHRLNGHPRSPRMLSPPSAWVKAKVVGWWMAGGGDEGTRTPDPLLAKEVLSQLSYIPAADRC